MTNEQLMDAYDKAKLELTIARVRCILGHADHPELELYYDEMEARSKILRRMLETEER